jgi:hypothetical protein
MAPTAPINWAGPSEPYTLLGDLDWSNYTVSCDVLLEQAGYVEILGRVGAQKGFAPADINAYYLRVTNGGAWSILKNTTGGTVTTITSGSVAALGTNTWHTLTFDFQGSTLTATIDQKTVGSVTDTTYGSGQVGLGVSGWQNAQYQNFSVKTNSATASYYYIVNRNSGKVLDISGASTIPGGLLIQYTNSGSTNQQWLAVNVGGGYVKLVNRNSDLVLDVTSASTTQGVQIEQWTDNGGTNQQWQLVSSGGYYTIVNRNSGLLLDVTGGSTANSAAVIQWAANGGTNQQWSLVTVS